MRLVRYGEDGKMMCDITPGLLLLECGFGGATTPAFAVLVELKKISQRLG